MSLNGFLLRRLDPTRIRQIAVGLLLRLPARERAFAVEKLLARPVVADTPHGPIRFLNHGRGSCKRALTLLAKEPDSLKWIDSMAAGSVFWDIGANIGTLTLYAAKRGGLSVWAFEPAAVNFYDLAANCEINGLAADVRCLQIGFGETNGLADLHVSQMLPARSFTFRKKPAPGPTGRRAKSFPSCQSVQTWTIDSFIDFYGTPRPNYLKIDVPGLTLDILRGARRTLARDEVREVQIEVQERGPGGKRVAALLEPLGFEIVRRHLKRDGRTQRDLVFGRVSGTAVQRDPRYHAALV